MSVILLLIACKNDQKIDVENIEKLYVDYNSTDAINYPSPFKAEVVMKLYTSEEISLTQQ